MAEECARGERTGWYEFVRDYTPIARNLIGHYFPTLRPELDQHVLGVFRQARADENAWFRSFPFAHEREFLMAFRELVFASARSAARLPAPESSLERARELMRELTVVERELFWMFLKGYDIPQTASILMNAGTTAAVVKESTEKLVAQLLPGGAPAGGVGRVLLEMAEKARTPECLPLRTINNIINGQISWHDRDRAEQHIRECVHCLDRFTSFQEMIWYGRRAQPLEDTEVVGYLERLAVRESRKSVVARLFSRSA